MAVKKTVDEITATVAEEATTQKSGADAEQPDLFSEPAEYICGFCVYIGPSIRGAIQSGTIYAKPVEQVAIDLAPIIQQYPQIASLIVSGDTLATDRVKVKTPGNLLHLFYEQLSGKKS